jgi:outer membrane protein OmpA-like peptidoglycan-associated protein
MLGSNDEQLLARLRRARFEDDHTPMNKIALLFITSLLLAGCVKAGPDKTAIGGTSGAALGAGAGAVIGNQIGRAGEGAGIGAGFGLVEGLIIGASHDAMERELLEQRAQLQLVTSQNDMNRSELFRIQRMLDEQALRASPGGIYQVFFDSDVTTLTSGAVANLQTVADLILKSPGAYRIQVNGHADDSGDAEYNKRISEARARNVVAYLGGRGLGLDKIELKAYGSERPVASNSSPTGRQLNRRVEIFIGKD